MAKFKYVGQYAAGRNSMSSNGVTFTGNDPADVPDDLAHRYRNNADFEEVGGTKNPAPPSEEERVRQAAHEVRAFKEGAENPPAPDANPTSKSAAKPKKK
jgi:hypothetical protein